MNPTNKSTMKPLKGSELEMVKGEEGEWVCPLCMVDDYLTDM
jgi:hypothetical protein